MKKVSAFLVAVLVVATLLFSFNFATQAKDKSSSNGFASQLDSGYSLLQGQRGFYQLRDSEGGVSFNQFGQLVPFGRKSAAVLTGIVLQKNEDGSLAISERGGFIPARSESGTILVYVSVFRTVAAGGQFDTIAEYGSREPGGFDIVQSADLAGL